ncbi:MAG: sulfate transporter [Rhodobacteraceae bacterium]|nr:MAG: sulfate transporter [Paracoccaceae bacterium]
MNGNIYMKDAKGGLIPVDLVKAQDQLQDETVRKIAGYALALSAQMARFKAHVFDDISAFEAILEQEYGATIGGVKGNKTLLSYDGLFKVQVSVADKFDFGPELQVAKGLLDECMNEWSAEAPAELRAIITNAFNTDKEGQINRAEIFKLLRLEILDERWQRAMKAIRDAMRVVGTATYVRCYQRPMQDAKWQYITIDLAKA